MKAAVLISCLLFVPIVFLADCRGGKMVTPPDAVSVRQIPAEAQHDVDLIVQGNTAFAFDLYSRAKDEPGNLLCSPYSISTALAMTWAGARGVTEAEMKEVLRFLLPQDSLHAAFGALQRSLERGAGLGGYRLHLANRLWGQTGDSWLEPFLRTTREEYEAPLQELDFRRDPEPCRLAINEWVEEQTEQKIRDLLHAGDIDPLTALVLTNAIYFKGTWKEQFDPSLTKNARFYVEPGKSVDVPTMNRKGEVLYGSGPEVKVLELPYGGGDLSMVFLLPPQVDGLPGLEAQLSPENLAAWMGQVRPMEVPIAVPRFRFTSRFLLNDALAALGMPSAFRPGDADLSGMDGTRTLFISKVIHQAFIEVNEEGTEAAGATAVVIDRESVGPTFIANHPFLFLIRDNVTHSILFLGRVVDPSN
jgi:serpin B